MRLITWLVAAFGILFVGVAVATPQAFAEGEPGTFCGVTIEVAQQIYGGEVGDWQQLDWNLVEYKISTKLTSSVRRDHLILMPYNGARAWVYLDEFESGYFALRCIVRPSENYSQYPPATCPLSPEQAEQQFGGMPGGWMALHRYPSQLLSYPWRPLGYTGGSPVVFVVPRHGLAIVNGRYVTPGYVASLKPGDRLEFWCFPNS